MAYGGTPFCSNKKVMIEIILTNYLRSGPFKESQRASAAQLHGLIALPSSTVHAQEYRLKTWSTRKLYFTYVPHTKGQLKGFYLREK